MSLLRDSVCFRWWTAHDTAEAYVSPPPGCSSSSLQHTRAASPASVAYAARGSAGAAAAWPTPSRPSSWLRSSRRRCRPFPPNVMETAGGSGRGGLYAPGRRAGRSVRLKCRGRARAGSWGSPRTSATCSAGASPLQAQAQGPHPGPPPPPRRPAQEQVGRRPAGAQARARRRPRVWGAGPPQPRRGKRLGHRRRPQGLGRHGRAPPARADPRGRPGPGRHAPARPQDHHRRRLPRRPPQGRRGRAQGHHRHRRRARGRLPQPVQEPARAARGGPNTEHNAHMLQCAFGVIAHPTPLAASWSSRAPTAPSCTTTCPSGATRCTSSRPRGAGGPAVRRSGGPGGARGMEQGRKVAGGPANAALRRFKATVTAFAQRQGRAAQQRRRRRGRPGAANAVSKRYRAACKAAYAEAGRHSKLYVLCPQRGCFVAYKFMP